MNSSVLFARVTFSFCPLTFFTGSSGGTTFTSLVVCGLLSIVTVALFGISLFSPYFLISCASVTPSLIFALIVNSTTRPLSLSAFLISSRVLPSNVTETVVFPLSLSSAVVIRSFDKGCWFRLSCVSVTSKTSSSVSLSKTFLMILLSGIACFTVYVKTIFRLSSSSFSCPFAFFSGWWGGVT